MSYTKQNLIIIRLLREIGIIEQLSRMSLERVLPDGMRISQFAVLNHLARLGNELTHAQLVHTFRVTKGAMTNTVQRLEALGLVEVIPHPLDGRSKRIRLTAAGYHLRNEGISAVIPQVQQLEDKFPIQEFLDALPFLQRLRAFFDDPGPTQTA